MKNDQVNIKVHKTGKVIKTHKLIIQIKIREQHNDLIKPSSEGGFAGVRLEPGDVIIGDTLLGSSMPPQELSSQVYV